MKLLFRDYLASLKEREELDAILPDLLSELGFTVYSRPQRGTTQAGVDIAAVGKDDDGKRKIFLFSVKQGDLTRQSWDGSPQALRPSLNEILDTYIPTKIPKRYQGLKIVICLVFGGDMQEQVRTTVTGFMKRNTSKKISFDEWNGDKLAGLLLQGVLREEIMPKSLRSHFQKAVAMVDEPEISYQHFGRLVHELREAAKTDKSRIRIARQMYIGLWVLFVWARDAGNVEAAYRASELVLLNIWDLLRHYFGSKRRSVNTSLTSVLIHTVQLHLAVASELLEKKILPHVDKRDSISMAVQSRSYVDVNLKLFDLLGRISLTGLWVHWMVQREHDLDQKRRIQVQISKWAGMGCQLIDNNRALFLPLQDAQSIEISLFLILMRAVNGNENDERLWLQEMTNRLAFTVKSHGKYPCVFTDYRDLVAHPRERTDEYRRESLSASTLIPLLAAFLTAQKNHEALDKLIALKTNELQQCTLQVWMPDEATDDGIYIGRRDHGVALCDLPLSEPGLLHTINEAVNQSPHFDSLSPISTDYWPVLLTACRHHRMPVPPQFWIGSLVSNEVEEPKNSQANDG